tara:strand:- start:209 stop:358 length:150 start_codon:yes stop_codon:yes gene_type:complete
MALTPKSNFSSFIIYLNRRVSVFEGDLEIKNNHVQIDETGPVRVSIDHF